MSARRWIFLALAVCCTGRCSESVTAGAGDAQGAEQDAAAVDRGVDRNRADLTAPADSAAGAEASPDGPKSPADASVPFYPPDKWGPYAVGVRTYTFTDTTSKRALETRIWYPGTKPAAGTKKVVYLILAGNAYPNLTLDKSGAPYPLVHFSHGNKGINFQSYSFTEYLASHGFVVVAPNHQGNTLFDNPTDQQMAAIALARPKDIAFVHGEVSKLSAQAGHPLQGAIKAATMGIAGHSFGGYTALGLSGAEVDVSAAVSRCQAGTPADILCPYIKYWTAGTIVKRPAGFAPQAGLFLAPGGYAAYGTAGLKKIAIPTMIMGGTLDTTITLTDEVRPIFSAIGCSPRYKVEITGAGHMSFTDICRIPLAFLIPGLDQFCQVGKYINIDKGFEIINVFGMAFFRYHLKGETAMASYLTQSYAATFPAAAFETK